MKVYLANDHAAFEQKKIVQDALKSAHPDWQIFNLGVDTSDRANYAEFALKVAKQVAKDPTSKGVLLCGSGIGMCMAANKIKGVRAALCGTVEEAKLSRQHNDANILCLGSRTHSTEEILKIVEAWFSASFEGGRHQERIDSFNQLGSDS